MGGKTRRASGNRKRLRLIFGRTNERTNERKERRKKTLEDARWVRMSTNGETRSYSEICDERVSLARRFARCGAKLFLFFRATPSAPALAFGVAKRTKKRQTRGWIVPSSSRRRSVRSIRAVSRYSRLVGVLSVVAGGSRTVPPRDRANRQNARSAKQSAKKSPTTPPVAARPASFLSSSSPSGILWWSPSSFVVLARRGRANVPRISRVRPPRGASALERRNGSVARRRLSSHPCSSPDE